MYTLNFLKKIFFGSVGRLNKWSSKRIIFIICFLGTSNLILYYMYGENVWLSEPLEWNSNVSCHYDNENDALPSAEDKDFIPGPNSIFFHETSCSKRLNSRQACAVESAARAHPERQVYVMFSAPVSEAMYQRSCIAKLRSFDNIRFARVHITDYTKNTPLETMVASESFNKGNWRVEQTANVLRLLTLYKWGGVYLDMDMLVVKSLTPLGHNWVARESNSAVNNAAIALSMDELGRKFADNLINEVRLTFRPDIWGHNGPGAITRVLHRWCNTSEPSKWSNNTCQGLEVYGTEYIYPVDFYRKLEYFKPGELKTDKAYTHHFWNKRTHKIKIEKDSPYENMAKKFCPVIYEMYGKDFGNWNLKTDGYNY